jgi:thymidylate synthase (FAD)|tara:strand:- start:2326 stop:2994 length:669 start_codon:yes stop_codon:yes gene_type:complete
MTVELIDHMGSDLSVVNAARVSFDKESSWEVIPFGGPTEGVLQDKDIKLIKYLAKHNHWTPFGHGSAQFRIKAPIFVARQLMKHQVGLVWNEVSRRYIKTDPEFWSPDYWRQSAENVKQGSSRQSVASPSVVNHMFQDAQRHCEDSYKAMIDSGVCAEQARAILPQSLLTEWYWSGTLMAFGRVYKLRCSKDAQVETHDVVKLIGEHMEKLFPESWGALCGS